MGLFSSWTKDPQKEAIKKINDLGCEYNEENFFICAVKGYSELVELFLKAGTNPNIKGQKDFTALMFASANGQTDTVNLLIKNGALIDLVSDDGRTALFVAVSGIHQETALFLINNGADVSVVNKEGYSILDFALDRNLPEIVKAILQKGVDFNQTYVALVNSIANGKDNEMIGVLLDFIDVNLREPNKGNSPLLYAVNFGKIETVEFLLSRGADINIQNLAGDTPITKAIYKNDTDMVKYLISKGANVVFDENNRGFTPLGVAFLLNRSEIEKILKEAGAN
jgi:ankyrin repeat protein